VYFQNSKQKTLSSKYLLASYKTILGGVQQVLGEGIHVRGTPGNTQQRIPALLL
jgi:hypothetical protein